MMSAEEKRQLESVARQTRSNVGKMVKDQMVYDQSLKYLCKSSLVVGMICSKAHGEPS